jgi:hypothetical protein
VFFVFGGTWLGRDVCDGWTGFHSEEAGKAGEVEEPGSSSGGWTVRGVQTSGTEAKMKLNDPPVAVLPIVPGSAGT